MLYTSFISYSHTADAKLAPALQSALHSFAKPWYRLRSMRVFRDKTNLAANPALWPSIESALSESEYFLLLASPQAAQSPWVEREIKWWLQNRSIERMLILLTDGELVWNRTANDYDWDRTTALPDNLRGQFEDEPLHVDLRWAKTEEKLSLRHSKFRSAVLDIAAPLKGKAKDELDGEDVRQHKKNKRWAWSATIILFIATISAIVGAYVAIQQKKIATENEKKAISRQLASQAELISTQQANLLPQSVILAAESIKTCPTFSADQALYHSLSLLGPKPVTERSYRGLLDLVSSPHGKYLVQLPFDGPAVVEEAVSGKAIANLINLSPDNKPLPAIRQISFSDDESRIATLSSLGISTFVWDLPAGREIFRTPENRSAIVAAVLSGDGNYLATGHTDGMVCIWNISRGSEFLSFSHSDPPYTIKFSPDGRYLAVTTSVGVRGAPTVSMVRLWDLVKNREVAQLQHASAVTKLILSPNGKYLATTSRVADDLEKEERIGRVNIWEVENGRMVSQMKHEKAINSFVFTKDSKYLLTGSSDETSRLWDVISGTEQLRIDHGSSVRLVDFLKVGDTPYFVTAGNDSVVRLWGAFLPMIERLRLQESPNILALAKDPDGQYLITISHDLKADAGTTPDQYVRNVTVWSNASIKSKLPLEHEHVVGGVSFSSDGRYLATFDSQLPDMKLIPKSAETDASFEITDLGNGSANVWEVNTRNRITHLEHPAAIMSIAYDSTGKYLATACVDGITRVWNALNGREMAELKREGWVYEVAFSPNGQYLAISSGKPELLHGKTGDAMLTIWEWQSEREVGHLENDTPMIALAFSRDEPSLAVGGMDGIVRILRTTDGREVKTLHGNDPIKALAFSPDGRFIATASGGQVSKNSALSRGTTTLWRIEDRSKKVLRVDHKSWAVTVAFSPDGKYVASMDQNGLVGVWTTADAQEIATMKHDEFVAEGKVHFSSDSHYLVTAFGNKAQIWDVSTWKEVARREHAVGYLWDAVFSKDGKYLATAGTDSTANLWLWQPEDLITEACSKLSRNLTKVEWRQYTGDALPYDETCTNLTVTAEHSTGEDPKPNE